MKNSIILYSGLNFGMVERKFGIGVSYQVLIFNFTLKNSIQVHFGEKNDFFFYFWLLCRSTLLRCGRLGNKRSSIFQILLSKHHLYNFRKSHKVSRKDLFVFELCSRNHRAGMENTPSPRPDRAKNPIIHMPFRKYSGNIAQILYQKPKIISPKLITQKFLYLSLSLSLSRTRLLVLSKHPELMCL